jgi:hypothetical protein
MRSHRGEATENFLGFSRSLCAAVARNLSGKEHRCS